MAFCKRLKIRAFLFGLALQASGRCCLCRAGVVGSAQHVEDECWVCRDSGAGVPEVLRLRLGSGGCFCARFRPEGRVTFCPSDKKSPKSAFTALRAATLIVVCGGFRTGLRFVAEQDCLTPWCATVAGIDAMFERAQSWAWPLLLAAT
ncbi:hypothetical protein D9M72_581920 [compost metagenome]